MYIYGFYLPVTNGAEPFTNTELMRAEAAFHAAGLNDYEVAGHRIRVPKSRRADYQGALADDGFLLDPKAPERNLADSGNIFEN